MREGMQINSGRTSAKKSSLQTKTNSKRTGAFEIKPKTPRAWDDLKEEKETTLDDLKDSLQVQQELLEMQQNQLLKQQAELMSQQVVVEEQKKAINELGHEVYDVKNLTKGPENPEIVEPENESIVPTLEKPAVYDAVPKTKESFTGDYKYD